MNRLSDFMLPPARSTFAGETDALFNFINIVSLVLLVGITIAIIYFVIKYKRRSEDETTPLITHHVGLEIAWSVIPLILVLIVFAWGLRGYMTHATPPSDSYEVRVVGASWRWDFHYENGFVSTNELHVPKDRPVRLVMSSDDVIHSFFVPDYRVKRDVLPNRYTQVWFEATSLDTSIVYCTEYCGTAHSNMLARVIVHEQDDFDDWLANAESAADDMDPVELGQELIGQQGCAACHSSDGSPGLGPTFQGLYGSERTMTDGTTVTADENYLRESLLEPNAKIVEGYQPIMPTFAQLNDRQLDAIIEYLKTID